MHTSHRRFSRAGRGRYPGQGIRHGIELDGRGARPRADARCAACSAKLIPMAARRGVVAAFESLPTADAPPPRSGHTAVRLGSDVVVFGGHVGGECTAATVALDVATLAWRTLETNGPRPRPRLGHAACAASETEMWVIGGGDGKHKLLSDVHRLSVGAAGHAAWSSPACTGAKLTGRMGHSLAHVPWRRALLCFGGFVKGVQGGYSTHVLLLDLTHLAWSEPLVQPQPHGAHAALQPCNPATLQPMHPSSST